jgi:dTDP-4-amino-4,6-dideoxygalactose transaminase
MGWSGGCERRSHTAPRPALRNLHAPMAPTNVPFVDLSRIHDPLADEIAAALRGSFERGDFILGEAVGRFEAEFADYIGAERAVGVGSGTAALTIATEALGIKPGAEVIVPGHTYIASALGPLHAGAVPVFCDVERESGLIDLASAEEVVSDRTEAIVAVHLYGQVCDMDAVAEFASKHGLAVIEDAAQAHGAKWGDRRAGSLGDAGCFSFYPSKNLGALGDGGAITFRDNDVASRADAIRNLGQLVKGEHALPGRNERLDTMQAGPLSLKLPGLDAANATRRDAAAIYDAELPGSVGRLPERPGCEPVYHLYPVRVPTGERDRIRAELGEAGIGTGIHYSPAMHEHEPFTDTDKRTSLTESEAWASEELSLPMFAHITEDEVRATCDTLAATLA